MSPAPTHHQALAAALAQAIGAVLRAILDAVFGDVSGLSPRHPVRRMHARGLADIERYVALLTAALMAPAEAGMVAGDDGVESHGRVRVAGALAARAAVAAMPVATMSAMTIPAILPALRGRAPPPGLGVAVERPFRGAISPAVIVTI